MSDFISRYRRESRVQSTRDDITYSVMKKQGMNDIYHLGQISMVEHLYTANVLKEEEYLLLLNGFDNDEYSEEIINYSKALIENLKGSKPL